MQRSIILEAVRALDHPTAEDVFSHLQESYPSIGIATVYRNLGVLSDQGLIMRLSMEEADRYDGGSRRHGHFKCDECGRIIDVHRYDAQLDKEISESLGCDVRHHDTYFSGVCAGCIAKGKDS